MQQEDLVVSKKQPNVLDKPKAGAAAGGGGTKAGGGGTAAVSQEVDVRKLTVS